MHALFAFLSGGLFGAGLLISGMLDTAKVQGWLDIFGTWDPTLAFVLGGTIISMVLAWRLTNSRKPAFGGAFPPKPKVHIDKALMIGSVLFGIGWGLVGLCPGPALASLTFNGIAGLVFLISMISGILLAFLMRIRLDARRKPA